MIKGFVGVVRDFQVRGWAFDSEAPDESIPVTLYVAGQKVADAIANIFRPDLLAAQQGNGRHGFAINVDLDLSRVAVSDIAVYALPRNGEKQKLEILKGPTVIVGEEVNETAQAPSPTLFPHSSTEAAHHPVFILGAARSGTSAVAQALMVATRYRGHEEGHLLDLVAPLLQTIDRHYNGRKSEWVDGSNTLIAALPRAFYDDGIRHIFVEMGRKLFPEGWWIDKTPRPTMIMAVPLLRQIWPAARFICMRRRAIENVASRMRKFSSVQFEDHCKDWAAVMSSWSAVRSILGGAAIEIDQYYLAQSPVSVAEALAPLLMLNADETENLATALASDRPERTSKQFASKLSLDDMDWPQDCLAIFQEICGPAMNEAGYGLGEDYFLPSHKNNGLVIL